MHITLPTSLPEPDWYDERFGVFLYNADCLQVMKKIPDKCIDIIWTDPPYGHNNNNGDLIHRWEAALGLLPCGVDSPLGRPIANDGMDEMEKVVDGMLTEAARVLNPCCCCCCCCCCGGGGPRPTFAWLANRMDRDGLSFFHAVVWDKGGLGMGWRYRRNYEMVMVAHRRGGKLKWETTDNGKITANVVRIPKIIPQATDHPTPKPVELPAHFYRLHAKPGDIVLDPFMGRAPAGVAAIHAGCGYIGIELDQGHFAAAVKRIEQAIIDAQGGDLFATYRPSMKGTQAELF